MDLENYTITFLIRKGKEYYTGSAWTSDIQSACLYSTRVNVESVIKSIQEPAEIISVIQNKSFDFYDGEEFVYYLLEAKLYTPDEAEAQIRKLAS
jgi:hypothetical protein